MSLDQAIINWVKREFSLLLGERTAEEIKMAIGSAFPLPGEPDAEIRGRDLATGLPKTILVTSADIRKALEEPVNAIINAVKSTLDKTPPELSIRFNGSRHRINWRRSITSWPR
jgi:rod shape-determining protein MreB and related proteins